MEKERTMAGIMDLCLANGWKNARLAKLMTIFADERKQKVKYSKGTVAAHVRWRKDHPAKPIEQTDEVIAADLKSLEAFGKLVEIEIVAEEKVEKPIEAEQPSNKPAKTVKAKAKTVKAKA